MNNEEIQDLIRKIKKDLKTRITEREIDHYFSNRIIDFAENKERLIHEDTKFCKNCQDIIFGVDKRKIFCCHHCFSTYKEPKEEEVECIVEKYLNK